MTFLGGHLPRVEVTAAGALPTRAAHVVLTPPAASSYAVTLAAPSTPGDILIIEADSAPGGAVTLALTNVQGGTAGSSASFNAANEKLVLIAGESKWTVLAEVGVTLS